MGIEADSGARSFGARLVYAIFLLSGAAALIYEIPCWLHRPKQKPGLLQPRLVMQFVVVHRNA